MATENPPEAVQARLIVDTIQEVPTYYVNHAEVAAGPHEFAVWFTRLPTRPSRGDLEIIKETGEYMVEPEVQLLMPHSLIDGLIKALQQAKSNLKDMPDGTA